MRGVCGVGGVVPFSETPQTPFHAVLKLINVDPRPAANVPIEPPIIGGANQGEFVGNFSEPMIDPVGGGDVAVAVFYLAFLGFLSLRDVQLAQKDSGGANGSCQSSSRSNSP